MISPNPLTKKIVVFLILFAIAALIRLIGNYQNILVDHNYDLETIKSTLKILEYFFIVISMVFFYFYMSIIFTIIDGSFSRKLQMIFIPILLILLISDLAFKHFQSHTLLLDSIGNLLSRYIIYVSLGYALIRALRSTSDIKKKLLYFTALYFSLESISFLMNNIFFLGSYYDSFEYFINNLIPFIFVVPFLQSIYPKPDTDFDKMKAVFQPYGFNERELSIIKLICDGKLNKEIASELGIAENTVKFYIYNIYKKINVKNRVELVKHITAYPPNKKPSLPR